MSYGDTRVNGRGYDAKKVANSVLAACWEKNIKVSPLKLQKLCYLLHAWHLGLWNEPAINDEFLAWKFGPVNEELYHEFKRFGSGEINAYAEECTTEGVKSFIVPTNYRRFYDLLEVIVDGYGEIDALVLSRLTHKDGSPWDMAARQGRQTIPNEVILAQYQERVNQRSREELKVA